MVGRPRSQPVPACESGSRTRVTCATGWASGASRASCSRAVGEYVELPSAAACCGAAGSYSVVRPEDSARVLDPHLDEIAAADLDVIAVVNAGCYRQLEQGIKRRKLRTRVVHLAELLAAESDSAPHESSNGRAEIAPAMLAKEVHGGLEKAPKSPAHPR